MDKILRVARPDQMDWQMRDRLGALRQELLSRSDTTTSEYEEWAHHKTHTLLAQLGLNQSVAETEDRRAEAETEQR